MHPHSSHGVRVTRRARWVGACEIAVNSRCDLQEFARFEISDTEVPADILEGKKTLLIHTAFELLGDTDRSLLQLCFSGTSPSEATVSKARELIARSGAVAKLHERMVELLAEADAAAHSSAFSMEEQHGLVALIRMVREAANRSKSAA